MDGEDVVGTRNTVVSYVDGEAERSATYYFRSGEVGVISVERQSGDAARIDGNMRGWIAVSKAADRYRFLSRSLEFYVHAEGCLTSMWTGN